MSFLFVAILASYIEAKKHKLQYLLYGLPPAPWLVRGVPIMQYTTEQGWKNCLIKMGVDADIVFYGNSITAHSDFQSYFPDKKICNLGIGGDDLGGLARRVEMLKAVSPEKVFFLGGINGSKEIQIDTFAVRYECCLKEMKDSLPKAMIYCQSLLPVAPKVYDKYADNQKIKKLNKVIKALCERYGYVYIDLFSLYAVNDEMPDTLVDDGIHLKSQHYERWAKYIKRYVYE